MVKYSQLVMDIKFKATASSYPYILFYKITDFTPNVLSNIFKLLIKNNIKYHYLSNLKFVVEKNKVIMNGSNLIIFLNELEIFNWLSDLTLVLVCWRGYFINNMYYNKLSNLAMFYSNNFYIIYIFLIYFCMSFYYILFYLKYSFMMQIYMLKVKSSEKLNENEKMNLC